MIGNPQYNYGDIVRFRVREKEIWGLIYIIDAFGTAEQNTQVSYDILDPRGTVLYKHIVESSIIESSHNIMETNRLFFRKIQLSDEDTLNFEIILKENHEPIGSFCATQTREKKTENSFLRTAHLDYCIAEKYQGVMTEAFERMIWILFSLCSFDIIVVSLEVDDNETKRVMDNVGMKSDKMIKGQKMLLYEISKSQWADIFNSIYHYGN